jgi:hypothetical protein
MSVMANNDQRHCEATPELQEAYDRGRADQLDICVAHNLTRIADVLGVIDRHAGHTEALRREMLRLLGHGGER